MPAGGARIDVPTQRGRAAALDGGQHFQVQPVEPGAVSVNEAPPCGADQSGHLQRWPYHHWVSPGSLLSVSALSGSPSRGLTVGLRRRWDTCR